MDSGGLITSIEQITEAWLTHVLTTSGALLKGQVVHFDIKVDERELSTSVRLQVAYSGDAEGERPDKLFLKMVRLDMEDEFFGPSEVSYYRRDYVDAHGVPIPHCYDAAYSEEQGRYHILMDDLSDTHVTAGSRAPALGYGLVLAEGLAVMHAHWWGQKRLAEINEPIPDARAIQQFTDMGRAGAGFIIDACSDELAAHWPQSINRIYDAHPRSMVQRTQDDTGFTLIHGDVNWSNILVPVKGEVPIYIIDRQPFNWSLTVWLGVHDLAYAMVLYWDVEIRRALELPVLRHYHKCLIRQGVTDYSWEQLWDDYRLCAMMGVYVATEWCRSELRLDTHQYWMPMLQRTLTAMDDLQCMDLL